MEGLGTSRSANAVKCCGCPFAEERPIEAEKNDSVSRVDHSVRMLGRKRNATQRYWTVPYGPFRLEHGSLDIGMVNLAKEPHAGGQISRADDCDVNSPGPYDLADVAHCVYVLDCDDREHGVVCRMHVLSHRHIPS